jgi:hypothetical protein
MARPLRVEFEGAAYHVTSRGNARQTLPAAARCAVGLPESQTSKLRRFKTKDSSGVFPCNDGETGGEQTGTVPRRKEYIMNKAELQNEKEIIATVVRNTIMWALTKDVDMQKETMAQDEDLFYFWTASMHTISGWKAHNKLFDQFLDPRFRAIRTEVRDLRIHLSQSGDVAWYSATLDDVVSWDGQVGKFGEDLRWTGVLEKRNGRWVIVQMHASLAIDKVREILAKEKEPSA